MAELRAGELKFGNEQKPINDSERLITVWRLLASKEGSPCPTSVLDHKSGMPRPIAASLAFLGPALQHG